ncbi:Inhibitor Of Growth Protein 3 [Manis pentadactyla]|nr:Inhibitor Of Growth Protein 3 [Manis pentadactyla]
MLDPEDYLEMTEQLPMDLHDHLTEMCKMDLQVQNAMDQLKQRVSEFFMNAKKNKLEWREEQMASIKKDYYKALEDADEKTYEIGENVKDTWDDDDDEKKEEVEVKPEVKVSEKKKIAEKIKEKEQQQKKRQEDIQKRKNLKNIKC